jgi:hypothetical protein
MSRAFVRERDTDTVVDLPDRPVSEHPNNVTEAGMAQIETAISKVRCGASVKIVRDDGRQPDFPDRRGR